MEDRFTLLERVGLMCLAIFAQIIQRQLNFRRDSREGSGCLGLKISSDLAFLAFGLLGV